MKLTLRAVLLLALLSCARFTYAQTYQIVDTQTSTVANNLTKTVMTVQAGANPLDRFLITRVVKKNEQGQQGTLLLLPPLGSGFQNYEAVAPGDDYSKSFAGFFARRGFDVWGYSQRVQGLTSGQCESGAIDCSAMATWGVQTILNDVAFIRGQIELAHPGKKPVAAGLSLGSILSAAVIDAAPQDYAGAIMIEGTIYDTDPGVRAVNAGFCAFFENQLANGVYYDGQNTPGFKLINHLAEVAPNAPSPIPDFAGLTNHQAWVAVMSAPPVGPTTPRPGYYFLKGSVGEDSFAYADEPLVHANINGFVDYVAVRTIRDLNCGLAGERTFTNNLGSFTGPVLMFVGGHGFGTGMTDTAALMTNAKVTVEYKEDYGHVDHVFSTRHTQEVEHPILAWLLQDVK